MRAPTLIGVYRAGSAQDVIMTSVNDQAMVAPPSVSFIICFYYIVNEQFNLFRDSDDNRTLTESTASLVKRKRLVVLELFSFLFLRTD